MLRTLIGPSPRKKKKKKSVAFMTERNGRIHQRLHSRHRKTVSKTKTFRKSWHHTMNINRFPHLFVLKASNKNAPAFYQRTWTKRTTQILGIKQETTQTHTRTHTYTECTAKNPLVICSRQKKKKTSRYVRVFLLDSLFEAPLVPIAKTYSKDLHVLLPLHQVGCKCFKQVWPYICFIPPSM